MAPARDASDVTYETTVQARYRDLDPMGHVNNAAYATYMEQTRAAFFREEVGGRLEELNAALAALSIEFERPIDRVSDVTVRLSVAEIGTTSATLAYEIRADEEPAATGKTVQVALDADGRPTPLPDDLRAAFERHRT